MRKLFAIAVVFAFSHVALAQGSPATAGKTDPPDPTPTESPTNPPAQPATPPTENDKEQVSTATVEKQQPVIAAKEASKAQDDQKAINKRKHAETTFSGSAPGSKDYLVIDLVAGVEFAELSSKPLVTEPFARLFLQSGPVALMGRSLRSWGSIRILGAPTQTDTNGIVSVFTDPSGQITTEKLSSVGTAVDFVFGPSFRMRNFVDTGNSIDFILGFGATSPVESNKITQAFTVPDFGTAECNILYKKFQKEFSQDTYNVTQSKDGQASGSSTACLLNGNSKTTTNGGTTLAPVTTLGFSSADRTSFLLRDIFGIRFNHTDAPDKNKACNTSDNKCQLGTLDFVFGHDAGVTGGVLRGNRMIFKADGVYPFPFTGSNTTSPIYIFGSFATRLERNQTDNTPLILRSGDISTLTGSGSTAVPNVNTIILPLKQPDRDFYRIGVGLNLTTLFKH